MSRSFLEENSSQLERLRGLIGRLTDSELSRSLGGGWTVSGFLGHLAFWDQRALLLIKRWRQTGVEPSPVDVDAVNDAMRPLLLALPPRKAAEIALEAATAIDQEIEKLSPDLISRVQTQATNFRLDRGHHRRVHIDQIEAALSKLA